MFIWRACQEILPTCENLHRRHIMSDPMCPMCGVAVESVGHILWNCQSAKDVWLECPTAIQKTTSDEVSFREVVQKMRDILDGANFLLFVTVAIIPR
jgi:tRNA(Ile2) C34 agmatinyltransferase TiaS